MNFWIFDKSPTSYHSYAANWIQSELSYFFLLKNTGSDVLQLHEGIYRLNLCSV